MSGLTAAEKAEMDALMAESSSREPKQSTPALTKEEKAEMDELMAISESSRVAAEKENLKQEEKKFSVFEQFFGALPQVATNIGGELVGGLAGAGQMIGALASGVNPRDAADVSAQAVEEGRALMPDLSTEAGTQGLQNLSESIVGDFGRGYQEFQQTLGDKTMDFTGSPELAALAYASPDAALELLGLKLGKRVSDSAMSSAQRTEDAASITRQRLMNPHERRSGDLARVKVDPTSGRIVKDKVAMQLMDEKLEPTFVASVTNADPMTKAVAKQMLVNDEKLMKNPGLPVQSSSQVLGKVASTQLKTVDNKIKQLGKELDRAVNGQLGQTRIPSEQVQPALKASLASKGLSYVKNEHGQWKLKPNQQSSLFSADDKVLGSLEKVIDNVYSNTRGRVTLQKLHNLKKSLDGQISSIGAGNDFAKARKEVLIDLRRSLNDVIASQAPDTYGAINQEISRYLTVKQPFQDFIDKAKEAGAKGSDESVLQSYMYDMARSYADKSKSGQQQLMKSQLDNLQLAYAKLGGEEVVDYATLADLKNYLDSHFVESDDAIRSGVDSATIENQLAAIGLSGALGNTFGAAHGIGGLGATLRLANKAELAKKSRQKTRALLKNALSN